MKKLIALVLSLFCIFAITACTTTNQNPAVQTGYPTGKIQQPQIMYAGQIYLYYATGYDEPLPDGYEFVGKITGVDNNTQPSTDFHGAIVEMEQDVYASKIDSDAIYVKYDKGYARFTTKNK